MFRADLLKILTLPFEAAAVNNHATAELKNFYQKLYYDYEASSVATSFG